MHEGAHIRYKHFPVAVQGFDGKLGDWSVFAESLAEKGQSCVLFLLHMKDECTLFRRTYSLTTLFENTLKQSIIGNFEMSL